MITRRRLIPAFFLVVSLLLLLSLNRLSSFFWGWAFLIFSISLLASWELFSLFRMNSDVKILFTAWNGLFILTLTGGWQSLLFHSPLSSPGTSSLILPVFPSSLILFLRFFGMQCLFSLVLCLLLLFLCRLSLRTGGWVLLSQTLFLLPFGLTYPLFSLPFGNHWCYMTILNNKVGDTGALVVGKKMGRIKLAPSISPNKTVEGLVGGVLFGTLSGFLYSRLSPLQATPVETLLGINVLVSLAGHAGDLLESFLKRKAHVKDSGSFFGDIGGVMDLTDCFSLSLPMLALGLWIAKI